MDNDRRIHDKVAMNTDQIAIELEKLNSRLNRIEMRLAEIDNHAVTKSHLKGSGFFFIRSILGLTVPPLGLIIAIALLF